MKSKIIKYKEPIEQLSMAWVKELREYNKTKRTYEIDPYVEVYQFRDNVYGLFTESADGMGSQWMFLVIGPEKALLIDTAFGIGNLKGLVDELTGGMPVIVANTHASVDHSYGNCQFERAYCHEYAVPYMKNQLNPHIWDYLFDNEGNCIWLEFDRNDIIPYKDYEIIGCPNHHIFDLGGEYEVELIFLPGHQAGHCGFLDKKNRILFCGDDLISMRVSVGGSKPGMPYGEFATVTALRNELEKLVKRLNEFDTVFPGHYIVDIDSSVVKGMLDACIAVVENPNDYDFMETQLLAGRVMKFKFVRGLGVLSYNDNSV